MSALQEVKPTANPQDEGATVVLRLALVAPTLPGVLLGVGATAFVLALAWIYARTPLLPPDHA